MRMAKEAQQPVNAVPASATPASHCPNSPVGEVVGDAAMYIGGLAWNNIEPI